MKLITVTQSGNGFDKLEAYLKNAPKNVKRIDFDSYGLRGVEALKAATPRDTGKTAESWQYRIVRNRNSLTIEWFNTNYAEPTNIPVAILIQHGHATRSGGYVAGRDFINPALKRIFDDLTDEIDKEVNK